MNDMYMSYCRFEGTLAELRACMSEVYDHVNEEAEYEVSDREINYFRQMVEIFFRSKSSPVEVSWCWQRRTSGRPSATVFSRSM